MKSIGKRRQSTCLLKCNIEVTLQSEVLSKRGPSLRAEHKTGERLCFKSVSLKLFIQHACLCTCLQM
jgi:hypothetical protein